jgi:hypothetical protein
MKLGLVVGLAGIGVLALTGYSQAAVLTVPLDVYPSSQYTPTGVELGEMVVKDVTGGVDVTFSLLNGSQYWASTGGPHMTVAFNLNTTITSGDVTILSPTGTGAPTFTFTAPTGSLSPNLGDFTAGEQGDWSGTSNHFSANIELMITGLTTSNFVVNTAGFFAAADILAPLPRGQTGEVGGNTSTLVSTPEPSTWAMMIIGFAGLAYAGYRKTKRAALSVA